MIMANALLGGVIIGYFVIGWLGVFILPVFVAIYQCIALFNLKRKGRIISEFVNPYAEIHYNLYTSQWSKWIDSIKIYLIQFAWTYITTAVVALMIYFIKNIILK